MAPIVKVAVIQLYPKVRLQGYTFLFSNQPFLTCTTQPMQLKQNFDKAANFVRSAAAQGAELAVLPEYHLTNWVPNDAGFLGLCEQWETYLQKYRDLARECKICKR